MLRRAPNDRYRFHGKLLRLHGAAPESGIPEHDFHRVARAERDGAWALAEVAGNAIGQGTDETGKCDTW